MKAVRSASTPIRVVTMCTHNRTRSVLMGALLSAHAARAGLAVSVITAGVRDDGLPATAETVRLLAGHGIDASQHRSHRIDDEIVEAADLIVTAEREHVVFVSGRWPGTFERTFTLPELLNRAQPVGPRGQTTTRLWLQAVGQDRPRGGLYLTDPDVLEIDDPTGLGKRAWQHAFAEIDVQCAQLVGLLS